jgi:galactosyl transferase GMA12/MNN10 family
VRKALATFGSGPAAELLVLAFPSFVRYAQLHGYEIVVGDVDADGRAPAWGKVPFLRRLLESYDFVLWIDADALILDPSVDLETIVPADAFQAFAVTRSLPGWGSSPCLGVWAFRAGPRAQRFLAAVWEQEDLIEHAWWEQTALMRLTGWRIERPLGKEHASEWDDGTFFLDEEWDMIPMFPVGYAPGRIRHYAGWSYRRRRRDMRTDLALARGAHFRHWLGLLERRARTLYEPVNARLRRFRRSAGG